MAAATTRVFNRLPGTDHPSADGKLYMQQGFDVITKGLANQGWTSVVANNVPASKNRTYAHTPYMFIHGERGGPLQTYLVSANGRTNFHMWLTTAVTKIVRTPQGHATGVIVEPYANGGYAGTVNLTQYSGRVIVAAGTFASAKLLFRSGIGPTDQLEVVKTSTDGPTMINSTYWINLPVGYNLDDHVNTDTVISHPNISYYDWYGAWDAPIAADKSSYLTNRTGPLAQAAPNIGPMFWEEIKGADGVTRQLQWTARVEGSLGAPNGQTMTLSQYLGRGALSRGRTTINQGLNMQVTTLPYLIDKNDVAAVVTGIANLQKALNTVQNLTWIYPAPGQSAADYVANVSLPLSKLM
jgi:cellobiose dehydrogenase (acceptor)